MSYNLGEDIRYIRTILDKTQQELADDIGVEQVTISRSEQGVTQPSNRLLAKVYNYAYENGIYLNRLKEMFCKDNLVKNHILLFHGAKSVIDGHIDIARGRTNNDMGQGFYTGESYEQAASFISGYNSSSIYYMDFNPDGLKGKVYTVDQDWMLMIAYYRGALEEYANHPLINKLIMQSEDCDYIVAPIADNRMFQIINSFIDGEITDEQCKHCLAATNLGNQYVFKTQQAVNQIKIVEHCYITDDEKRHYLDYRSEEAKLGEDKVKLARRQYRGKGRYIDDILE